jgi:hypothetical protein
MTKSSQSTHSSEYEGREFQVDNSRADKSPKFYAEIENMAKSEDANYSKEEIEELYWSEEVQKISNTIGDGNWHARPELLTKRAMALHNTRRDKLDEAAHKTLDSILDRLIQKLRVCDFCGRVTETAKGNSSHYTQVHI